MKASELIKMLEQNPDLDVRISSPQNFNISFKIDKVYITPVYGSDSNPHGLVDVFNIDGKVN